MELREIADPETWNTWLEQQNPDTFLQSWEWGEVQRTPHAPVFRYGFFVDDRQIGAAQTVFVPARRGRHLLIPHGPIVADHAHLEEVLTLLLARLKEEAAKTSAVAIKIAPLHEDTPQTRTLLASLGFRPAPLHVHAELTWERDIAESPEAILANMRKTTRHAIRNAERAGVQTEVGRSEELLKQFWPLYEQTGSRHDFITYRYETLRKQLETFGDKSFIVVAQHEDQDIAAGIFFQFGTTVFYYHGASTPNKVSAAQAVQWAAIQEAKRRGATRYNFWGIAPESQSNHPFTGITVFKKGFGGEARNYLQAHDLPLGLGYWPYWALEQLRKRKRGF